MRDLMPGNPCIMLGKRAFPKEWRCNHKDFTPIFTSLCLPCHDMSKMNFTFPSQTNLKALRNFHEPHV